MKHIKVILLSIVAVAALSVFVPSPAAHAVNVFDACSGNSTSTVCKAKNTDTASSIVKKLIETMLQVLGSIAVIMIVVGAFRYTTSDGDASRLKNARDTIVYSAVGLVVAIMSYAIVNFVVDSFGG